MLGRQTVAALGVRQEATVIQLDVPDSRQGNRRSRLRFYIGDQAERPVLRIDTSMPVAGALTLTLVAINQIPQ